MVELSRDGFDYSVKFSFNPQQIFFIVFTNKVDCHTSMTKSARSADSMQISVG